MKKISKVAALLAASALLFGGMFLSCSDSDDGDSTGGGSSTTKPTPTPTPTPTPGTEDDVTVDALWDFKTNPDNISTSNQTVDLTLSTNTKTDGTGAGSGATLVLNGTEKTSKWKNETAEDGKTATCYGIYAGNKKSTGVDYATNYNNDTYVYGKLTLTLLGKATIEMKVSGNGSTDSQWVVVSDSSNKIVGYKTLENDVQKTLEVTDAEKGIYTIWMLDSRIQQISAKTATEQTTFTAATDNSTANDLTTLGLIGTVVTSSDTSVATAEIAAGKIAITSVKAGDASITVKNAADKSATIAVSVSSSGKIEVGTITKFTRSAPTATVTSKPTSNTAKDGAGTVTWDGLTDLEYSTDGETFASATDAGLTVTVDEAGTTATITGLAAGTYYVRGKASDDYEATESTTVTVGNSAAAKTTDSWDLSKTAVEKFTVNGYAYSGTGSDYTYTAATALSTTAAILAEDYVYAGASGNLNLTISKYSGTGVGNSKAGVTTAPDWNATSNNKPGNSVQWKTHDKGLIIKRDGIKISGVKGSVKLKITFGITSKKDENNRFLEVTVGSGETVKTSNPVQSTDPTTYSVDVEGGTEGVDVYIGASNELYLQSITIE